MTVADKQAPAAAGGTAQDPLLDAARREMEDRARAASEGRAPMRTDASSYEGAARIRSVNTSPHKDAHAGRWHRHVSLLAIESIRAAQARGLDVKEGDFGENVTTEGINLLELPLGTQVRLGDEVLLEISQIGKVCHTRCAIYYLAGDCIFPHEGIFGVVLRGGTIHVGDAIEVVKTGDGTCSFTPAEALAEVEQAKRDGTL